MSDKPAGWYPDPDGANRQRYWDGDAWTEYYTPLAPEKAEIHGAATALNDYPYLTATRAGAHQGLMATPVVGHESAPRTGTVQGGGIGTLQGGTGAPHGGWPTAAPPSGEDGETLEFSGGGRRSSASRWALVAASVLVIGLVAGLGWWALGGRAGDGTATGPTTSTPAPTDGETLTASLPLGTATNGEVPVGGAWIGTLDLDAGSTLVIDARADGDADLALEVRPAGEDTPVADNDDRGGPLASLGDSALNPLVVATLPAGSYDVVATEVDGAETTFDITAQQVTAQVTPGSAVSATVPASGAWFGLLEVPADGSYRVDVDGLSADDGDTPDPLLVMVGPDGDQLVNDDRGQDDRDPLLEQTLGTGSWVLIVSDFFARSLEISVEVTALG